MGFLKPNPEKKAARLRRKAQKRRASAAAADAKAAVFDGDVETTLEARGPDGKRIQQDVKVRGRWLRTIQQRLQALDDRVDELEEEVHDLTEDRDEFEKQVKQLQEHLERRQAQTVLLSGVGLKAMRGFVRILNASDRPTNPGALVIAEALKLSDLVGGDVKMDKDMANLAELASTAATMWAFYNPDKGLSSLFQPDDAPRIRIDPGPANPPSAPN